MRRVTLVLAAAAVVVTALGGSLAQAQPASGPASMYGLTPENTNTSRYVGFDSDPFVRWSVRQGGVTPVVCIGPNGVLYPPTGQPLWASTGAPVAGTSLVAGYQEALDVNGHLYRWEGGHLRARWPDGTLLWEGPYTGYIGYPPTIGHDGTIYASIGMKVFAYEPDGSLKWEMAGGGRTAVSDTAGNVYLGAYLSCFSVAPDGQERWRDTTDGPDNSDMMIGPGGHLYYTKDDYLYVRSADTGQVIRQRNAPGDLDAIGADGTLYFRQYNRVIAADDWAIEKWRFVDLAGRHLDPMVVDAEGKIFLTITQGYALGLSQTGQLLWDLQVSGTSNYNGSRPTVGADGTVYFSLNDDLVAVLPEPGALCLLAVGAGALLKRRSSTRRRPAAASK
jgi:hypothetical protein